MRYKKESIDYLLSTVNIVDIVSDKVALKKSGAGFKGLCPFHDEKTPSFIVSPQKNIYKCFGCGVGGDALSFVMNYEKLSYIEAVEYLAQRYNYALETVEGYSEQNDYEIIYKILDESRKFFSMQLKNNLNKINFYLEKRNLDEKLIDEFSIGYAPDGFDNLYNYLKKMNFPDNLMFEAGVITINKYNKSVDRFINRLIFPIFSENGKTLGFGGRIFIENDEKKFAKYINSKESKVYHKSEVLYGLNFAKHSINQKKEAVVVEGYLDVIALHKYGVKNVVAASGTAFTDKQIKKLKKYTNKLILCFDGDSAGEKAAQRMIVPTIKNNINTRVVTLPLNEDPDSYISKVGKDDFLEYLKNNEVDIIDYFIKTNLKRAREENEILNDLLELLCVLEEDTNVVFILKKLSKRFEIPLSTVIKTFRNFKQKKSVKTTLKTEDKINNNVNVKKYNSPYEKQIKETERELLAIFLDYPRFLNMDLIALFENENIKKVLNLLLEVFYTDLYINREQFLDKIQKELSLKELNYLKLLKSKENIENQDDETVKNILNDYFRKLDFFKYKKYIDNLKKEISEADKVLGDIDFEEALKVKKIKMSDISDVIIKIKNIKNNVYIQ